MQQTSVSLPNSCDIIDSNINDSAVHNWAWPTEWKYSHGTKAVDVTGKFTILICQRGRQWTQHSMSTSPHWLSLRDLAKYYITAGLISSAIGSTVLKSRQMRTFGFFSLIGALLHIRIIMGVHLMHKAHILNSICRTYSYRSSNTFTENYSCCFFTVFSSCGNAWQSQLKVLGMTWKKNNYQRLKGSWWLKALPVIKK